MAWRIEHRHLPSIEHGQLLAGGLLSGPSAASDALHGSVSPYPGVCSRCIPAWDRPQAHRPGRVSERKEPKCRCVWCGARVHGGTRLAVACAVLPCSPAGAVALSGNLGVSGPYFCTQPSSPWGSRMSRRPARRIEHLGVARMSRGRGTGQCGLTPPLSPLKPTGGAPPYELA